MCVLILDLIPLWRSQLRHLRLRYSRWKAEQGVKTIISHIWCLPAFMSTQLPTLFCSVVRAMSISWTQVYFIGVMVQRIASWLSLAKCKIEMQIDKLNQQCSKLALLSYHKFQQLCQQTMLRLQLYTCCSQQL